MERQTTTTRKSSANRTSGTHSLRGSTPIEPSEGLALHKKRKRQRQVILFAFLGGPSLYLTFLILVNLLFIVALLTISFPSGPLVPTFLFVKGPPPRLPFPPLRQPTRINRVDASQLMSHVGYVAKPKVMGVYFANSTSSSFLGVQVLPTSLRRRLRHNIVPITQEEISAQVHLLDSKDYEEGLVDQFEDNTCKARYEWMYLAYPTCNIIHEIDLNDLNASSLRQAKVSVLSSGFWRDVWKIQNERAERVILKTLRYNHDFDERNYDRHRRDALASDRLTWSQHIINIYAFCGNSGLYEFAPGGDIEDVIFYSDAVKWNSTELLVVAYQVASAIADAHDSERNGIPAVAHTDITTSQFIHVDGMYKLNDFNRCRFIPFDDRRQRNCGFLVSNNPGVFRAPEEYAYELESEKVDIYSMGNVFYVLLTKLWPFGKEDTEIAQNKVLHGDRPEIPRNVRNTDDPIDMILLKVIDMCWVQDPFQRPTALEVKTYLEDELKKLGIQD